jgi:RimJ/RimL family protein N-acetyltransferase
VTNFTVAPQLPDDVLARRDHLPVKFAPVSLMGIYVRLEPLALERDAEALYAVSNGSPIQFNGRTVDAYDPDALIWRYMFGGPFPTLDDFIAYLRPQVEAANGLCLCVFDAATGRQVGVANYMNNFPQHLKVELGSIWYSPIVQRTPANTEATYLMLKHAFELGYRRLEWKCDALNERSRRAALRMGFRFEGIQDSHFIIKNRNRDTAWYRILDREWPEAKMKLEGILYGG